MKIRNCDLLDLYTDCLISNCGLATATGMSAALDNRITHDRVTDLLNSSYINSRRLWAEVRSMCDEIEQDAAVLIIDDSVEAKPYTDCNDIIQWHLRNYRTIDLKGIRTFLFAQY
jgi:hypothetical protein